MNHPKIVTAARQILKDLLVQCTESQQTVFKKMYCHKNMGASIDECVGQISESKIDWAIYQCERTVDNNKKTLQP